MQYEIVENEDYCFLERLDEVVIKEIRFRNTEILTIPEKINDKNIVAIQSFSRNNTFKLKECIIQARIKRLEDNLFEGFSALCTVLLPEEIKYIGKEAFRCCNNLININFPKELIKIGKSAFERCAAFKNINFKGTNLKIIENCAFKECVNLESVEFSDSLQKIGINAFNQCIRLREVKFPKKVKIIEDWSFSGTAVEVFKFPEQVKILGRGMLENCPFLKRIIFPKNIRFIPSYMCHCCPQLKKITIPKTVTEIGWDAFAECKNLRNVYIENPEINIFDTAFDDCNNLTIHTKEFSENIYNFCRKHKINYSVDKNQLKEMIEDLKNELNKGGAQNENENRV